MRRFAIAAVLAFCLLPVAGASGATFLVTSTVDSTATACTPQGAPGVLNCASLRRAVQEAGTNADATDEIVLGAGTFTLTGGELVLPSGLGIVGASPRTTIIDGGFAGRVVRVPANATDVILTRVTIDEGFANGANGGNILNEGDLFLFNVAVTGGLAQNGGGIANSGGELLVAQSLIEGNTGTTGGGAIDNAARSGTPGNVDVVDSTIAGNSGGAIQTRSSGNSVQLNHVTLAHNVPGTGLSIAPADQTVEVRASILYTNSSANLNCGPNKPTDLGFNVESADTCTFRGTGSQPSVDPQLSGGLTNAGGPTNVFTIAPTSPAAGAVAQCGTIFDQRGYTRGGNGLTPCDAGAYEIDGQPPTEGGGGEPTPTATAEPTAEPTPIATAAQTPAPTATPTPEPTPVAGKSVNAEQVGGKVLVKLPGANRFVPLDEAVIGNGSEVDARAGRVEITRADGGRAVFYSGQFKVSTAGGVTVLTLSEPLDCKAAKRSLAAAKKKSRKLWGDGKGAFRTSGKYSAATVRGTKWLVQDTCTTTTTKVVTGVVEVRDSQTKKKVVLRKGKSYVARARK
ncbi:hypothetical protein OJ998_00715 [Solirubrobacter taibaiensis]|nr:hypothetical protein [Solirubrobacter taibaiensis]